MRLEKILIIGCGNMGGAMLAGWLAGGLDTARFTVVDPILEQAPAGVTLRRDLAELDYAVSFDAVLLGVKPQMLGDIAADVLPFLGPQTLVLSILAGVELATLAAYFPDAAGYVRIMPNLAAALGKSPVALVGVDGAVRDEVTALMQPLGLPEWLTDEALFDAVTALAGSGPAFVYRFISALAQGGVATGLPPEQAARLALAMVEGAAALAAASPHDPAELARRVASPGGVTQVGLDILDMDDALLRLVSATLQGATARSAEMAALARAK